MTKDNYRLSKDDVALINDCLEELIIRRREAGIGIYHVQSVLKRFNGSITKQKEGSQT